jgi:hypothetical protein
MVGAANIRANGALLMCALRAGVRNRAKNDE